MKKGDFAVSQSRPVSGVAQERSDAELFMAEDVFAGLDDIGELFDALVAALRKAAGQAGGEGKASGSRFAAYFADLAALMTAIRWGAIALAKAEAAEHLAEMRTAKTPR